MCYRLSGKLKENLLENEVLELLGQKLIDGNYTSVNFRYSENDKAPKFKYVPCQRRESVSLGQFLKYLACLNYQSCEPDDYYKNDDSVFWDIYNLERFGSSRVNGYEDATWG